MANDSDIELQLDTDDDLIEDEHFEINNQPIYGKHTLGSFNRKVNRSDVDKYSLIVLKVDGAIINLMDIINDLILRFRLNYITAITYKVRRNNQFSIVYVYVTYLDEISRFMAEINTDSGPFFMMGQTRVNVSVFNNITFGSAKNNESLMSDPGYIRNVHFNFIPNNSISPSFNLMNIWEKVSNVDQLRNSIMGVSMRLNTTQRILFHYGSFILNDYAAIDSLLLVLRNNNIPSNRATFSSFILNENHLSRLQAESGNSLVINEFIIRNNILVNPSNIDVRAPVVVPAPNLHFNDIAHLIQPIIERVVRNLGQNNFRGRRIGRRRGGSGWRGNDRQNRRYRY